MATILSARIIRISTVLIVVKITRPRPTKNTYKTTYPLALTENLKQTYVKMDIEVKKQVKPNRTAEPM